MTVGVGFDDGDDRGSDGGAAAGRAIQFGFGGEVGVDGAEVGLEGLQVNARRRAPDHAPVARLANRVCSRRNASFTVPVGPLRCLARMISAMPSVSEGRS